MTTSVNLEQVAALLAAQLPRTERPRLVERIVHEPAVPTIEEQPAPRADWMSLRGIVPNLLGGQTLRRGCRAPGGNRMNSASSS